MAQSARASRCCEPQEGGEWKGDGFMPFLIPVSLVWVLHRCRRSGALILVRNEFHKLAPAAHYAGMLERRERLVSLRVAYR
jgi:hypothetical protein